MKTNKEIVAYFLHQYEELKKTHVEFEIINLNEIEDPIALYAEMMDTFNNVVFSKREKNLQITIYK